MERVQESQKHTSGERRGNRVTTLREIWAGGIWKMERNRTWDWINSAVEMIPFGLLAGFYGEKEVRITKLAEEGFCFRVSVASEILKLQESLRLCFYNMKQNRYQEIAVTPDAW